ncbi:hypothetical protein [Mycoplasma simbae]|uniref:hypothetical protein n=1 Tax=Mycoplasma simbae TaxID=36744 RepID=UPI0004982591|nr:hypothetical protein [Mycoplasma simbae]
MSKKYNTIFVLSIAASVLTTTAVLLTTATKSQLNINARQNNQNELDKHIQILTKDIAFVDSNNISEAQSDQFKQDLQNAKAIHAKFTGSKDAFAAQNAAKLQQLDQKIKLLEAKLANSKHKNNVDSPIDSKLDELEAKINAQQAKLSSATSAKAYLDVFNSVKKINQHDIESLRQAVSNSNNQQIKTRFDSLSAKNNSTHTNSLNRIKELVRNEINALSLISTDSKNINYATLDSTTLPEQAYKLSSDLEKLNDNKEEIKIIINASSLLSTQQKTDFINKLTQANDIEAINSVYKEFLTNISFKASAIDDLWILNLFSVEIKNKYKNQIIEQGADALINVIRNDYNNKLQALEAIHGFNSLAHNVLSHFENLIVHAEGNDNYAEIVASAQSLNQKIIEATNEINAITLLSQTQKSEIIGKISNLTEPNAVTRELTKIKNTADAMENTLNQVNNALEQASFDAATKQSINNFVKNTNVEGYKQSINFEVYARTINDLINKINSTTSTPLSQEQKQKVLAKLAKAVSIDDLLKVQFDFKTESERNKAKARVQNNSYPESGKKERIITNIEQAKDIYLIKIAEQDNDRVNSKDQMRYTAQSNINNLEYISQSIKDETNRYLNTQNSQDTFNAKLQELTELNNAKKSLWEQLNINESNFNKFILSHYKYEFLNAKTADEYNSVLNSIREQNNNVDLALTVINWFTLMPAQAKNDFREYVKNVDSSSKIEQLIGKITEIKASFDATQEFIQHSQKLSQQQKDSFNAELNAINSIEQHNEIWNRVNVAVNLSEVNSILAELNSFISAERKIQFNEMTAKSRTLLDSKTILANAHWYNGLIKNRTKYSASLSQLSNASNDLKSTYEAIITSMSEIDVENEIETFSNSKSSLNASKTQVIDKLKASQNLSQEFKNMLITTLTNVDSQSYLDKISAYIAKFIERKAKYFDLINNSSSFSQQQKQELIQQLDRVMNLYDFVKIERLINLAS